LKVSRGSLAALLLVAFTSAAHAQAPKPAATSTAPKKPAASTAAPRPRATTPKSSAGRSQRLDGIAAVVNDDVVLQSELEEQVQIYFQNMPKDAPPPDDATVDTVRHQILEQLVNEKLIVAEAKRQGVTVSDAEVGKEVERALDDIKSRLGGEEAFQQQLRAENMTEARLKEKYRQELSRSMLAERMRDRAIPRKSVVTTDAEAVAYFKAHPEKFPKRAPEVKLSVIQIPVTADSAADAAGKVKILEIRKRISSGEKFAKVAAEVSEDPGSANAGGDLGFFTRGRMDPNFENAAFSQPIGRVGDPVRSIFGWHLIEVIERDTVRTRAKTLAGADSLAHGAPVMKDSVDAKGQSVVEAHARHILVRVATNDDDAARAEALAGRVRAEAVKGTDFATLVRRYSKYQGAQSADGDIGFVPVSSLQNNIRAGLDTLEAGEISPVLQNAVGFNIFKLTDRKPERPYQLEEIRNELPDFVTRIKFSERFEDWMKGLRTKAHIEIKKG